MNFQRKWKKTTLNKINKSLIFYERVIFLTIDEMVGELLKIKDKHGNLEVVLGDYDVDFIEVQKYIKTSSDYNDIIFRHTEDMNETWLEEIYIDNNEYSKHFVSKGVCVKIY